MPKFIISGRKQLVEDVIEGVVLSRGSTAINYGWRLLNRVGEPAAEHRR